MNTHPTQEVCKRCEQAPATHGALCDDCARVWYRVYIKLEAVATTLQMKAYADQVKGRKRAPKQFHPCPKGTTITARLGDPKEVIINVLQAAALAPCKCHPGMTLDDLMELVPTAQELGI